MLGAGHGVITKHVHRPYNKCVMHNMRVTTACKTSSHTQSTVSYSHNKVNRSITNAWLTQSSPQSDIIAGYIVYGPVTETLHPPGDFWRPLFLETLAIGLLKSGCLQKSQCWIKPWGRFFSKWPPNFNKCLVFGTIFFVFQQFSLSLMKYKCLGLYYITVKSS